MWVCACVWEGEGKWGCGVKKQLGCALRVMAGATGDKPTAGLCT